MSKEKKELRGLLVSKQTRMTEILDGAEKEKRGLTEEERAEYETLEKEREIARMKLDRIKLNEGSAVVDSSEYDKQRAFGEYVTNIRKGTAVDASFGDATGFELRAVQDTTSVADIIPLTIGDIIEPLEKGLILSKVGVKMQTGLVGDYVLPVVAGVEATIEDENAVVGDTTIDITKLKPTPRRVSIAVPVSYRAIDQSANLILDIVKTQISKSLTRLLNKWMFSATTLAKASAGCFVKTAPNIKLTAAPTYKNITNLIAAVMKEGVIVDGTASFVCTAQVYADLSATPRAGGDRMIIENGQIDGYPVFTTEYMAADTLGFGVFIYELVGQFGKMRLDIENKPRENKVYFVMNTDFDMLTIRPEAFATLTYTIPAGA